MSRCTMPFACAAASPRRQLPRDVHRLGGRQRAVGERLAQRRALEQLGDEVRLIVVGPDVVDREDVRVVQGRGRAGFLLEAAQPAGIASPERGSTLIATSRSRRESRAR